MTAAELRSLTVAGSVLPCSPVRFVGPDGAEFHLAGHAVTCETVLTDAETKQQKPGAVPVLTIRLHPTPQPVTEGAVS